MKTLHRRRKTIAHRLRLGVMLGSAILIQCSPRQEPAPNSGEVQARLESVRKERDSLLEKLDASTRERVDLDGELNRLRQEIKELKESNTKSDPGRR